MRLTHLFLSSDDEMDRLNKNIMREYFGLHGLSKRLSDEIRTLIRSTVPCKPSNVQLDTFSNVIINRIRKHVSENTLNTIIRNASMFTPTHPSVYLIYALDELMNGKNIFLDELDVETQVIRESVKGGSYWPSYILVGIAVLITVSVIVLVLTPSRSNTKSKTKTFRTQVDKD